MEGVKALMGDEKLKKYALSASKNEIDLKNAISLLENGHAVSLLKDESAVKHIEHMFQKREMDSESSQLVERPSEGGHLDKRKSGKSGGGGGGGDSSSGNALTDLERTGIKIGAAIGGFALLVAGAYAYSKYKNIRQWIQGRQRAENSLSQEVSPQDIEMGTPNVVHSQGQSGQGQ